MLARKLGVIVATIGFCINVSATVLTFDGFTDQEYIDQSYGDRVTSNNHINGYSYLEGNGYTPNITVDYVVYNRIYPEPASIWLSGYAELQSTLGNLEYLEAIDIIFTPDSNFQVILNSFDYASWNAGNDTQTQPDSRIRIFDDFGSLENPNLFDISYSQLIDPSINPLSSPIQAQGALHLYIDNFGSLGVDNLSFDQATVPIPSAVWFFLYALGCMVSLKHRRRPPNPL